MNFAYKFILKVDIWVLKPFLRLQLLFYACTHLFVLNAFAHLRNSSMQNLPEYNVPLKIKQLRHLTFYSFVQV